jgi:hypothetical protein
MTEAQRNASFCGEGALESLCTAIYVTSPVAWKQSTDLFQPSIQACSVYALLADRDFILTMSIGIGRHYSLLEGID